MNVSALMDRYADALDRITKRRGTGSRDATCCALLLEAIAAECLAAGEAPPGRPPIVPSTTGHPLDAQRFARDRQHVRDQDDDAILRLLGRR